MTTIFQTLVRYVVAAATVPPSRQRDSLTSMDHQGARRRKRHTEESTTRAPPSTSVNDLEKLIDSSMPGIVYVTRVLSRDSQTAVKCQISSYTTYTHSLVQPQRMLVAELFSCKHQ